MSRAARTRAANSLIFASVKVGCSSSLLAINAALFVVEFGVGWVARSTALLGDSLDMLGDALVYAFSIWVLHRGAVWRARASYAKGVVQLGFGLFDKLGDTGGGVGPTIDCERAAFAEIVLDVDDERVSGKPTRAGRVM